MATELDIEVPGYKVVLAMILDGRESARVPAWWLGYAPVYRFRPLPPGPLIVVNPGWSPLALILGHSDSSENIARWQEGQASDAVVFQNLTIEPQTSIVIVPLNTFLGIQPMEGNAGYGVLRPVGILTRGPSSMPDQVPFTVQFG